MFLIAGDEHSCDEIECCAPAGRRRRRVPAGTLARTRSHTCNRPRLSRSLRRQGHTWTLSSGRVACDGTPTMCVFLLYTASAEGFIIIYLLRWVTSGQFSHKVSSRRRARRRAFAKYSRGLGRLLPMGVCFVASKCAHCRINYIYCQLLSVA